MSIARNELVIRIKGDGSVVVEDITDGVTALKNITPEDLLHSIRNSVQINQRYISSGLLPKNCIAFSSAEESEDRYVAMEFDAGYADISYYKTEYQHFPIPRLVFGFYVNSGGRITNVHLGVTANEKLTGDSQMYEYPFSNVSGFHLCTGANHLPEIKCLSQLSGLPWFILSLPNNDDRFNHRGNRLDMGYRELLEHLKNKNPDYYYEHVLIPMKNKTLKDFIKQ